jgi:hypothetical protein
MLIRFSSITIRSGRKKKEKKTACDQLSPEIKAPSLSPTTSIVITDLYGA